MGSLRFGAVALARERLTIFEWDPCMHAGPTSHYFRLFLDTFVYPISFHLLFIFLHLIYIYSGISFLFFFFS